MITVAAAIIENEAGEILICRRAGEDSCAGLWEFPGGKLEQGETTEECVVRECVEELGITVKLTGLFDSFSYQYPDRKIQFAFYKAKILSGQVKIKVHQEICWASRKELSSFSFCPADIDLVERLREEDDGQDN